MKGTVSFQLPASGFQPEMAVTGAGSWELAAGSYSLIPQRLRRIELRRLTRWIDRRDEADRERGEHDDGEIERLQDEGDVRDLIDVDWNVNELVAIEHVDDCVAEHCTGCCPEHANHQS